MEIILMRHGRAEPRELFHDTDELRPLTRAGRKRLKSALPGLRQVVPHIDQVMSSPLLRALQTAEIVLAAYPAAFSKLAELAPGGDFQRITDRLAALQSEVVLLVGHEPDLGQLASWYLTGSQASFLPMKKGAICQIHFQERPAAAQGELRLWLGTSELRRIGA